MAISRTAVSERRRNGRPPEMGRSERSNALIVSAAMAMVAKDGTHSLCMRRLGESAGYSRGLANIKFGTKQMLFADLLRQSTEDLRILVARHLAGKTGLAAIDAYFKMLRLTVFKKPQELRGSIVLAYETIGSNEAARKVVAHHHDANRDAMAQWIREAARDSGAKPLLSPPQLAILFNASMTGLLFDWLSDPEKISLSRDFQNLRRVWYRLLGCDRLA